MLMNDTMQSILRRQSHKSFTGEPLPDDALETILEAGRRAPSGMNRQPSHFVVIKSPEMLERIYQALRVTPGPGGRLMDQPKEQALRNAPVLVFVCSEDCHCPAGEDAGLACGLATENMLIAAASLGIMGGWCHVFVKDFFQNPAGAALKAELVPEGYTVQTAVFYGYPASTKERRPLREGTVTII